MKLQQLMSYARRAIDDYSMIQEGDKIAVGVSGGKDSMALIYCLKGLQRFYPNHFELEAISVDLGFGNIDFQKIEEFCKKVEVPFSIASTDISSIVLAEAIFSKPLLRILSNFSFILSSFLFNHVKKKRLVILKDELAVVPPFFIAYAISLD